MRGDGAGVDPGSAQAEVWAEHPGGRTGQPYEKKRHSYDGRDHAVDGSPGSNGDLESFYSLATHGFCVDLRTCADRLFG